MAGAPHYYSTVNFNDPAICKAVNTEHLGNVVYITSFLSNLLSRLGEGIAQPNLSCLQTLSTIADTPVIPTAPYAERQLENRAYAQSILDGYFYSLPRPQTLQFTQDEDHDVEEIKDEMSSLGRTRPSPPMEYTEHLPPVLANLLGDYYSTCGILTEDGKKCGLGSSGGFQFLYPSPNASTSSPTSASSPTSGVGEWNNCQRECTSDLCPQWLGELFSRIPKVVTLTDSKTGVPRFLQVDTVRFSTSGGLWSRTLSHSDPSTDGSSSSSLPPISGSIAALCNVLNAPRKDNIHISASIQLPKNTPNLGNVSISFPEFKEGYFLPSSAWKFDFARITPKFSTAVVFASLTIPPRA